MLVIHNGAHFWHGYHFACFRLTILYCYVSLSSGLTGQFFHWPVIFNCQCQSSWRLSLVVCVGGGFGATGDPQGATRNLLWSNTTNTRIEDPKVHCYSTHGGGAPLGSRLDEQVRGIWSLAVVVLSILSYPRFLSSVFSSSLLGACWLCLLLFFYLFLSYWLRCEYLPSDWLERSLWWNVAEEISTKTKLKSNTMFYLLFVVSSAPKRHSIWNDRDMS